MEQIGQPPQSKVYYGQAHRNVMLEMRRSWNMAWRVDIGQHVWI